MAPLQRVFIDTSELFPFTIMDLLLTMSEDFLFTWVWTEEVIEEWKAVIVREGRRTTASAAAVEAAIRTHFGPHRIDPSRYRSRVEDDLSPDPNDRVHAAACIYGDVDVLLTRNLKDLRSAPVLAADVQVLTSDEFLCELLARRREGVIDSVVRAAGTRRAPSMTPEELADIIASAGAPAFAARVRPLLTAVLPNS